MTVDQSRGKKIDWLTIWRSKIIGDQSRGQKMIGDQSGGQKLMADQSGGQKVIVDHTGIT